MKLVRYQCGCVGLPPDDTGPLDRDYPTIFEYCATTYDDNTYGMSEGVYIKDVDNHTVMSWDETAKILKEMSRLVMEGYNFRTIKDLLK